MDLLRRAGRYIPASGRPQLPVTDEKGRLRPKRTLASRMAYFKRPLRLKGNSTISVPLGVVILFPIIVVALILLLFVRHPSSPARILMPAGSPPTIRYVYLSSGELISPYQMLTTARNTEKSAKSTTRSSSRAVSNQTPASPAPTPPLSSSRGTRSWMASSSP